MNGTLSDLVTEVSNTPINDKQKAQIKKFINIIGPEEELGPSLGQELLHHAKYNPGTAENEDFADLAKTMFSIMQSLQYKSMASVFDGCPC